MIQSVRDPQSMELTDYGHYLYRRVLGTEEGKLVLRDLLYKLDLLSDSGAPEAVGARRVAIWLVKTIAFGDIEGSYNAFCDAVIERALQVTPQLTEREADDEDS